MIWYILDFILQKRLSSQHFAMPKKFKGENSKAVEARARKAAVQKDASEKKQQALEDEYWKDEDKHVAKKQQRKVRKKNSFGH